MDITTSFLQRDATSRFLRQVAADYREGRARPTWEIPSVIASCLENLALKAEHVPSQESPERT